ncbi:monofunctional biosynthetic peptidoglycan transglycosylase [Parvularcula sp. LCG005]|uniref:monofunctional biosynthetic peptidoglycan transglycosylase n=1 Tax=Parvularcula sp. LCG005 TaxID=3078805 RepID=UPI0029421CA5|nr:monofunctional biosynthetic peptidoglycan transglycosylase [Parvularcula sp. LCG005]WOI52803.1 monofunctional biosynthetic peptidoglycan transglycosylase [Parvularcula sp. LCG005]
MSLPLKVSIGSLLPWLWRCVRYGLIGAATFVGLSIAWVWFYGFAHPPETMLMGIRRHDGMDIQYTYVPISQISPNLVRAVISAEDTKFCSHHGFDLEQIKSALNDAEDGGRLRGASTISQQTAKNAFLWPGRGFIRKGMEAWFTLVSEVLWSKTHTMEVYLNVAEWGDGLFGAEAAAQARFGKSARDLTEYEAALLAAVLPNPNDWRVAPPGPYVQKRTRTLQARMAVVQRDGLDRCVLR